MVEDLLLVAGVLVASLVCGWYVVQALTVVVPVPAELCTTATDCLALAMGQ